MTHRPGRPSRRGLLSGAAGLIGAAVLGGCDRFAATAWGRRTLKAGEDANLFVQRLLLTPASLAREFSEGEISPWFKPNGTIDPPDTEYKALAKRGFATFTLRIDGLVEHPQDIPIAALRALPARTQITRHDCVEGWSAIGQWTGVPLAELLTRAKLKPQARFVVFHCADTMELAGGGLEGGEDTAEDDAQDADGSKGSDDAKGSVTGDMETQDAKTKGTGAKDTDAKEAGAEDAASADAGAAQGGRPIRYYESIDLVDAFHPQTILAYEMNGKALPVSNGAPLRLRVERQLGYKQAKYVMRIEVVDSLAGIGDGLGGYWEDRGYEWYAGI